MDSFLRSAAMIVVAMATISCSAPPKSSAPDVSTTVPPWRTLFNGRDLDQWTPLGTAHWRVDHGSILGTQDGDPSRAGILTTRDSFQNFELVLDFGIEEFGKYNSGVYLRNQPGTVNQTGYQVNIGRGVVGEYCGGLYYHGWLANGDVNDVIRRPNKWNSLHIIADGPHITVDLNGVRVVNFVDPHPDENLRRPGVIALQTYAAEKHPGWVRFRNIRVRELPPSIPPLSTR